MKKKLRKIVMITGATSGIGKSTARIFAKKGYHLILTGRRKDRLGEISEKYSKKYVVQIETLKFDIRNWKQTEAAFHSLSDEWKSIDILINNAGLAQGFDKFHEANVKDWETMIDTNIKGLLYISRLVAPLMVEEGKGHIVNVCSSAGHEVPQKGNVYSATKHAVDALTKAMRLDLYEHGIRVSQVSPGYVEETEFALVRFRGDKKKSKIYEDFNPLTSKDVADVIYYITTRPVHVNIQDVLMYPTQQASSYFVDRSGRKFD